MQDIILQIFSLLHFWMWFPVVKLWISKVLAYPFFGYQGPFRVRDIQLSLKFKFLPKDTRMSEDIKKKQDEIPKAQREQGNRSNVISAVDVCLFIYLLEGMGQMWHLLTNCFLFINHLNLLLELLLLIGQNRMLLECLSIIVASIGCHKLEQQLITLLWFRQIVM